MTSTHLLASKTRKRVMIIRVKDYDAIDWNICLLLEWVVDMSQDWLSGDILNNWILCKTLVINSTIFLLLFLVVVVIVIVGIQFQINWQWSKQPILRRNWYRIDMKVDHFACGYPITVVTLKCIKVLRGRPKLSSTTASVHGMLFFITSSKSVHQKQAIDSLNGIIVNVQIDSFDWCTVSYIAHEHIGIAEFEHQSLIIFFSLWLARGS